LDLQRVTILAGLALLAFACGEKFTAAEAAAGGAGGQAGEATGATSGFAIGGDGAPDGGVETGGGAPLGGKVNGGRGGVGGANDGGSTVAGSGGSGGSVVEVPSVPLEGLELWFDADVGVTQMNGGVVSWSDRSGHQRDALQPSTMSRPKLGTLNGKAALVFDGVDDHLRIDAIPGNFSKGVSIFVMMQQDVDVGACTAFFEASNGPEIDDVHLGTWQGALLYEVADNWVNPSDHPLALAEPQLAAAVHRPSQTVELRRNRNTMAKADFALPTTIPREAFIGYTQYNDCQTLTGIIGEILVYSRGVSDPELIQIESYLSTKWDCCGE
jgi:hypothetical protein